jgi:hypothetical protein
MCFFLGISPASEVQKMSLGAAVSHHRCSEQEHYGFTSATTLRSHVPDLR